MEFIIISGLSGAGKSRAASIMEDMGFFCVDNLPAPLIPKFAELGMGGNGEYDRVALVTDVRGGTNFDGLFQALKRPVSDGKTAHAANHLIARHLPPLPKPSPGRSRQARAAKQ